MKELKRNTVYGIELTFIYGKRDIKWETVNSSINRETTVIGKIMVTLDQGQYGYDHYRSVYIRSSDNPSYVMEMHRFEPGKVNDPKGTSRGFFEKLGKEYQEGVKQ